jgi:TolB-like protein
MNANIINNTEHSVFTPAAENESAQVLDLDRSDARHRDAYNRQRPKHRILNFLAELRRRQVCRTITMYSVALWMVCQIVDVISPQLGLPVWTVKFVIVLGLIGFPIAIILSWLFDITRDGVVVDRKDGIVSPDTCKRGSRNLFDQVIDCSLVLAALVIGVQLATGILTSDANSASPEVRKVAILPFRVAAGKNAEVVSQGLISELQHEIASTTDLTVVAPREPFLDSGCLSLTGAVAVSTATVRVTATLIDNKTGEITWSQVFERPNTDSILAPAAIAKDIVAALPQLLEVSDASGFDNAS